VKNVSGSVVFGGRVLGDGEVVLQLLNKSHIRLGLFLLGLLEDAGLE